MYNITTKYEAGTHKWSVNKHSRIIVLTTVNTSQHYDCIDWQVISLPSIHCTSQLNNLYVDDVEDTRRFDPLSKYRTKYDEPGKQLLILYGSEYGFSEEVARKLFDKIADNETYQELSIQPRVVNAKDFNILDFTKEQVVLCLFSTTGDG